MDHSVELVRDDYFLSKARYLIQKYIAFPYLDHIGENIMLDIYQNMNRVTAKR